MRAHETRGLSARSDRGAVLIEIVISIALFAGAAAFTLAAASSAVHSADRTARLARCVDLARSRMAELEAGMITLGDLRGSAAEERDSSGTRSRDQGAAESTVPSGSWTINVKTTRSEFSGLTLVELTVREAAAESVNDATGVSYTLRQLVKLQAGEASEQPAADAPATGPSSGEPAHFLAPGRDSAPSGGRR